MVRTLVLMGWIAIPVFGEAQSGKSLTGKVRSSPPYVIIGTQRTSTMRKELSEAVSLGYRALLASNTPGSEKVLLLEKPEDPGPCEYLLIACGFDSLEKQMNEAAARGFRLLPRTVIPAISAQGSDGDETTFLFERKSAAPALEYEYQVATFPVVYESRSVAMTTVVHGRISTEVVDAKLAELAGAGFSPAFVSFRAVSVGRREEGVPGLPKFLGVKATQVIWWMNLELVVLLERNRDPNDPTRLEVQRDSKKRYHLMTGVGQESATSPGDWEFSQTEFETMLNNAAAAGYHLLSASPMAFPEMAALVERNPQGTPLRRYRVLKTTKISTLEKELAEALSGGWIPHPRGLLRTTWIQPSSAGSSEGATGPRGYGERIGTRETVLVTENIRNSASEKSEYRILSATRTTTLENELLQAAGAGFKVVTLGAGGGEVVIVLKLDRRQ